MSDSLVTEIVEIAVKTAERIGYDFAPEEVESVLRFTERKLEINGKGDDYLPILFENELEDYVKRRAINFIGFMNFEKRKNA